jgi:hypothetical protein
VPSFVASGEHEDDQSLEELARLRQGLASSASASVEDRRIDRARPMFGVERDCATVTPLASSVPPFPRTGIVVVLSD